MRYPDNCRPKRSTKGSAGYDFISDKEIFVPKDQWMDIDTGVYLDGTEGPEISLGISFPRSKDGKEIYLTNKMQIDTWFLKIYPRSGHGVRYKVRFSTSAIIDQDYRGEIKLQICAEAPFTIKEGDKYAQGIFMPYLILNDEESPTEERTGGFGSTDVITDNKTDRK